MAATIDIPAAGYRYVPYAFQYSGGVAALDGHQIERVEFARPLPLAAGFAWIEDYLRRLGVPLAGVCACELRSPAQFTDAGFIAFNRHYIQTLKRWGVMKNDNDNPVARSNVIPPLHKPAEPSFHAFCFARPAGGRVRVLRHCRQRRGGRRARPIPRAHGPLGRDEPRRHAREGGVRARADGGAHGGAGQDLGRYDGDPGLHGA